MSPLHGRVIQKGMALRRDEAGLLDVDLVFQTSCCGNSYCEKGSEYLHEELHL